MKIISILVILLLVTPACLSNISNIRADKPFQDKVHEAIVEKMAKFECPNLDSYDDNNNEIFISLLRLFRGKVNLEIWSEKLIKRTAYLSKGKVALKKGNHYHFTQRVKDSAEYFILTKKNNGDIIKIIITMGKPFVICE